MFTRICKTFVLGLFLAGCGALDGFGVARSAPVQIELPDGLVISGERGWCVDKRTTRARADVSVVVLGSCAALGRNALLPRPPVKGVVTVSVTSGVAPEIETVSDYLRSEAGIARLARNGQAESVELLSQTAKGDVLYLQVQDKSLRKVPDASERYWRAFFGLDGNLVSVALFSTSPLDVGEGRLILERQVGHMRRANKAAALEI